MIEYLLVSVRDTLRTALLASMPGADASKAHNYVRVAPGGQPPDKLGAWFIGVDELSVQSTEKEQLRQAFEIGVWITRRTGQFATGRGDEAYLETTRGLRDLERGVIRAVHNRQAVRVAANTLAGAPAASPVGDIFQTALWYVGRGPTMWRGGDWCASESTSENSDDTFAVRQLRFAGGSRVEALDVI